MSARKAQEENVYNPKSKSEPFPASRRWSPFAQDLSMAQN
jgi:hypothetical protein